MTSINATTHRQLYTTCPTSGKREPTEREKVRRAFVLWLVHAMEEGTDLSRGELQSFLDCIIVQAYQQIIRRASRKAPAEMNTPGGRKTAKRDLYSEEVRHDG